MKWNEENEPVGKKIDFSKRIRVSLLKLSLAFLFPLFMRSAQEIVSVYTCLKLEFRYLNVLFSKVTANLCYYNAKLNVSLSQNRLEDGINARFGFSPIRFVLPPLSF